MNAAPHLDIEPPKRPWRARRRETNPDEARVEFPATVAAWARSTRELRDAYAKRFGTIPPELLTPREAIAIIARMRIDARDRGVELELPLSLEQIGRAHEARERTTPWLAEPVIYPLVQRLSRGALGYCNATEYSLRLMAWVDTGHVYGEHTIGRLLRAGHAAGELQRKVIPRGARFKNGEQTRGGTTTNQFPSERERRERLWKERNAKRAHRKQRARAEKTIRREPVRAEEPQKRVVKEPHTAVGQVLGLRGFALLNQPIWEPERIPSGTTDVDASESYEARRAREIKRGEAWMAAEGEKPRKKPPD